VLPGRTVRRTRVVKSDILGTSAWTLTRRLKDARLRSVDRRGKNIVIRTDEDDVLVVNLGMTGRLLFFGAGRSAKTSHPAVRFDLGGEARLVYDDVRRFGRVELLTETEWLKRQERLGPEPLARSFSPSQLHDRLQHSRTPVRTFLLDQRRIAGVGNIYANEALHMAGIHPRRAANTLSRSESESLHRSLRRVLRTALRSGGTTLRDYRDANGNEGRNAPNLRAYGRASLPCPACGHRIRRIVFGGRSAFVCLRCQAP
jgi:formamidopyrimidine-DNA glycosylase